MKTKLKYILHWLLGFKNYLFVFSLFKIYTLRRDKNENDFFSFLNLIPENTIVLDIGANIGIMTVHLAQSVKNSLVYSFEPIPSNIGAFKRVIRFFKLENVKLFELALGNTEGEVEMVMPVIGDVRMQGLSHIVHKSIEENNEGVRFRVPLKKLDTLLNETEIGNKKISAIKIDVENFEYFVLDGAKEILEKHRPVVYAELWDNENRLNCFELFKTLNYKTYIVSSGQLINFEIAKHKTQNFIFKPL
jgi:FkbM family methyltransferase